MRKNVDCSTIGDRGEKEDHAILAPPSFVPRLAIHRLKGLLAPIFSPPCREYYGPEHATWRYVYKNKGQRVVCCASDPTASAC